MMKSLSIILLFSIFLWLIACSKQQSAVIDGEKLFKSPHIGKNHVIGCISCHSLKANIQTVGPSLQGISQRAGLLVPNLSAQEYIKQSILNPDAYIVSGYSPAVMFSHYKDELSNAEVEALIDFLLQK